MSAPSEVEDPSGSDDQVSVETVVALLSASAADHALPEADLERLVRAEGLDAGQSEQIVDAARRLHGAHTHLQRRTQELAALFSTARELVQLHDVDTVLQRLVERAHDIIGTDVTYLSEIEPPSGGLRVRHSVGTVSAPFRDLIVPSGKGLASKVVEGRAPVWVARYEDMDAAPRDPGIDAAVATEGLVSFLGVPMAVGEEILGALFACNRFSHDFTPDQVVLLSAFADHAAAVLNSARLLHRSHEATQQAERAYEELAEHVAQMERASLVHESMTAAVVAGGSIEEVLATLSEALDRPGVVLDAELKRLSAHPHDRIPLPPGRVFAPALASSRATGHCVETEVDGTTWITVAVVGADALLGAIVMPVGAQDFGAVERRLLERAAHVAALLSLKREAVAGARADRRSRVLRDLLDGVSLERADPTGELASFDEPVGSVAALSLPEGESVRVKRRLVQLVDDVGIFAVRGRHVVVLWAADDGPDRTERLREQLQAEVSGTVTAVFVAVSGPRPDLVAAVDRVERCLEILPSLDVAGTTVSADVFVPYQALVSSEPGATRQFIEQMLGPVIAWDERRRTELVATLAAYFAAGESGSAAGRRLHVHKNTIQQRLERIQELTGGDWSDAEYRFRLQAAVRLHSLRAAVVGTHPRGRS